MTHAPVNEAMTPPSAAHDTAIVDDLVSRARRAQQRFEAQASQERYDKAAKAPAFARHCPDCGQRVGATVRLTKDATVTTDELITHCRARLGAFRAPDRIHVLADLPRGPSGKVQRTRLSGML